MSQQTRGQSRRKNKSKDDFTLLKTDVAGVVKTFLDGRGYGFIDRHSVDQVFVNGDVFFHKSQIVDYHQRRHNHIIDKEDEVIFDLGIGSKGYVARRVRLVPETADDKDDDEEHESKHIDDPFDRSPHSPERKKGDSQKPSSNFNKLVERDVTGVVKRFIVTARYGFIDCKSIDEKVIEDDVFFHHSHIVDEHHIKEGDRIIFDLGIGTRGYVARRVRLMCETDDEERSTASDFSQGSSNFEESSDLNSGYFSCDGDDEEEEEEGEDEYETESNFHSQTGRRGGSQASNDKSTETSAKATAPPVSASVEKRYFGNVLFRSADEHEAGSQPRVRCLKEALKLYKEAYLLARTDDENVSAAKNVAVTSMKLATLCREHHSHRRRDKVVEDHFMEAAEYFAKAHSKKNCKSSAWGSHLDECLESCVREYLDLKHTPITLKDITFQLDAFRERLPNCSAKVKAGHFLALGLYEIGFEKAEADDEECLRYMARCLRVLGDAERQYDGLAGTLTILPQLRKAVNDCIENVKKRMAKSAASRLSGKPTRTSSRATAPPVSASEEKRTMGNGLFRSADDHEAGSQERVRCLKEALELYKEAYQLARTDDEGVSAAKNVAVTSMKLATLYREHRNHPSRDKGIENHFIDAAKYFAKAYSKKKCKSSAWAGHLDKCIEDCLQEFRRWISHMTATDKASRLEEFLECLPICQSKAVGKVLLAQYAYNIGLERSQINAYEECLRYMRRCLLLLDDAERTCGGEANVMTNVRALRKDVDTCKESVKKRKDTAADVQRRLEREKQETEEKAKALESLKPKLRILNLLASQPAEMFVKRLYNTWPPKSSTGAINCHAKPSGSAKKCLLHAIACYHPDKVDKAAHGMEWYYFCCEVTKSLNKHFEKCKQ